MPTDEVLVNLPVDLSIVKHPNGIRHSSAGTSDDPALRVQFSTRTK